MRYYPQLSERFSQRQAAWRYYCSRAGFRDIAMQMNGTRINTRRLRRTIWILGLISCTAGVLSLIAIILAIVTFEGRFAQITQSRRDASYATCVLVRGLARSATADNQTARAATAHFIRTTPLRDCVRYSRQAAYGSLPKGFRQ